MALTITKPIEKEFHLEKTDSEYASETKTVVTIRQASQREHERRMDYFSAINTELGWNEVGQQVLISRERRNVQELYRKEAYLTMSDCNIMWTPPNAKKERPLFKFKNGKVDMTEQEFAEAWGMLPVNVANEIHDKVIEMNPDWGPGGEVS